MPNNYFDTIGELAQEIKKDGRTGNILAKRLLDNYDSDIDYSRHRFLCPFHNDKHLGNFSVRKNRFQCYSCGEEGSIIDFVMKFDGLDFPNATVEAAHDLEIISDSVYQKLRQKNTQGATFVKKEISKEVRNQIADKENLNKVYSLFAKGQEWLKKPKLAKKHLEHLQNERHLTMKEIQNRGFFTFPSIYVLGHIIQALDDEGMEEESLYHIPGFFYDAKREVTSFQSLRNNSGIGIPIQDIDGNIVGIQIRLDTVKEGEQRYVWFSSSFATTKDFQGGTSPGTPVSVCYPVNTDIENLEGISPVIFITEGYFKAIKLAETFNSVVLSVQGVHNWREIPYILDELKKRNSKFRHVYIMYDADMSYKAGVLQPAIKLGLSLTNLNFMDCKVDVENILTINRKGRPKVSTFYDGFLKVEKYLRANAGIFKFNIVFCLWDADRGKGIDDFLETFETKEEATEQIQKLQLIQFWDSAYHYLEMNDNIRESIMLKDGLESISEVELDDDVLKDNFEVAFKESKFLN